MVCRTMQLRFLKLGTVLTYAFNKLEISMNYDALDNPEDYMQAPFLVLHQVIE